MHTTALTVRQRRYVTATTSREGRSPLVWQTTYTHVDTRNDVARRHPSRLFDFNALATVTGHSSSCNSLRPFAIRKILASIFIAFPRKNASATTTANIVLGTWYIPVYIYIYDTRRTSNGSSTTMFTSTSTVAAAHGRILVGITNTYLLHVVRISYFSSIGPR